MKNQIVKTVLTVVAFFSLASNATSLHPDTFTPVAELSQGGGMPGPGFQKSFNISIDRMGVVTVTESFWPKDFNSDEQGQVKQYILTTISSEDLQKLTAETAKLSGGEFQEPNQPGCMDAPSTYYNIYKMGVRITVQKHDQCRKVVLADRKQRASAQAIADYLEQLRGLIRTNR